MKLTKMQREKSFAAAEASLKLEGLTPSDLYYKPQRENTEPRADDGRGDCGIGQSLFED